MIDVSSGRAFGVGRKALALMAVVAVPAFLVGCSTNDRNRDEMPQQAEVAKKSLAQVTRQGGVTSFDPLVVTDKVWAGDVALRIQRGIPLPPKYETERGITMVSSEVMTMGAIATAITAQTGIPVRLSDLNTASAAGDASDSTVGGGRSVLGRPRHRQCQTQSLWPMKVLCRGCLIVLPICMARPGAMMARSLAFLALKQGFSWLKLFRGARNQVLKCMVAPRVAGAVVVAAVEAAAVVVGAVVVPVVPRRAPRQWTRHPPLILNIGMN